MIETLYVSTYLTYKKISNSHTILPLILLRCFTFSYSQNLTRFIRPIVIPVEQSFTAKFKVNYHILQPLQRAWPLTCRSKEDSNTTAISAIYVNIRLKQLTTLMLSTNNQTVDKELSEANSLNQILYLIGFRTENQRNHLITDSFMSFNDLQNVDHKAIEKNEKNHKKTKKTKNLCKKHKKTNFQSACFFAVYL